MLVISDDGAVFWFKMFKFQYLNSLKEITIIKC